MFVVGVLCLMLGRFWCWLVRLVFGRLSCLNVMVLFGCWMFVMFVISVWRCV